MEMLNLVLNDASVPDWYARVFDTKDEIVINMWLHEISRLEKGWMEANIVFKAFDRKIFPFIEEVEILDYCQISNLTDNFRQ